MAGILELSGKEIKTTINMLKAVMDNIETIRTDGQCKDQMASLRKNSKC